MAQLAFVSFWIRLIMSYWGILLPPHAATFEFWIRKNDNFAKHVQFLHLKATPIWRDNLMYTSSISDLPCCSIESPWLKLGHCCYFFWFEHDQIDLCLHIMWQNNNKNRLNLTDSACFRPRTPFPFFSCLNARHIWWENVYIKDFSGNLD